MLKLKENTIVNKTATEQYSTDSETQKNNMIQEAKEIRDKAISNIQSMFSNTVSQINTLCKKKNSVLVHQTAVLSDVSSTEQIIDSL